MAQAGKAALASAQSSRHASHGAVMQQFGQANHKTKQNNPAGGQGHLLSLHNAEVEPFLRSTDTREAREAHSCIPGDHRVRAGLQQCRGVDHDVLAALACSLGRRLLRWLWICCLLLFCVCTIRFLRGRIICSCFGACASKELVQLCAKGMASEAAELHALCVAN
jgi:hypothetical protein